MEPRYTFSADQKSAFRAAITSHNQWGDYRQRTGITSAELTIGAMIEAARHFGINPADYGTEKGPAIMAFNQLETRYLNERFAKINHELNDKQAKLCLAIFATSDTKQSGQMTSRQYTTIASICRDAENGTHSYTPRARAQYGTNANATTTGATNATESNMETTTTTTTTTITQPLVTRR